MTELLLSRDKQSELLPFDRDAAEIGELYRKFRASLIESVHYALECGQRLTAKKRELGHGNWLPWLEAYADVLGMNIESTPQRLMKAAAKFSASAEYSEDETLRISREIWGHNVRGIGGTGDNEWFTPSEYLELARSVLGQIDLDPASHDEAQTVVRARQYFTEADDGLAQEWHGCIWLNPPYAQPLIAQFIDKMVAERTAGRVSAAIMLTHNYTDAEWFETAASVADVIGFTCGRVRFVKADGELARPTQGQALFYFGGEAARFTAAFKDVCYFVFPARGTIDATAKLHAARRYRRQALRIPWPSASASS
jgi:phage N-6-adenine-methyltransferase